MTIKSAQKKEKYTGTLEQKINSHYNHLYMGFFGLMKKEEVNEDIPT